MSSRTLSAVLAILVLAVLATGCGREPFSPTGLLFPVQRLLGQRPSTLPAATRWGELVKIGGEERPAVASGRGSLELVVASPPDAAASTAEWSIQVPERLRTAPWLLVNAKIVDAKAVAALPDRLLAPAVTGPVLMVDAGDAVSVPGVRVMAGLTPVPALGTTDVVSEPFTVPAGGIATVGMGIEEAVWKTDAAAVEFRISVVDGSNETIVHRTRLDPVRRLEDRGWRDGRADLGAFAGRTVRLKLATAPVDPASTGTSLPVWADPVVLAPRPAHAPNVIVLSLDTLRAKSVSAYGARRPTTPALDRLVGEAGTVFDFAYTTAPHTLPAHLSLFTSLYVRTFGGMGPLSQLSPDIPTLPERMRAAGYDTAAFTEDGFVVPRVGFNRGFASYRENTSPNLHEPLGQSAKTFRAAIDWLSTRRDRPTFLFVHTYEVHFPYTPTPPYDTVFEAGDALTNESALELLRYEQETRYLDDEVRAFLTAIDGLGLGTRTLLVVVADHGEEFMEHGMRRHGFQLYDEAIRIPFMMRLPGVVPAGRRIATPVSLVDVAPTILELIGAPPLFGAHGESLVPLLDGRPLSEHRRAVFSEAASALTSGLDLLSVRTPDVHCIYRTRRGTSECFDPAVDVDEKVPILGADGRPAAARDQAIAYWSLRRPEPLATVGTELVEQLEKGHDPERLEKLRSLGYVE